MQKQEPQNYNVENVEPSKWVLGIIILAITVAPLFALAPYVFRQMNKPLSCEDLEREYLLAELNMKQEVKQKKADFFSQCVVKH